jgi:hypothetical protein
LPAVPAAIDKFVTLGDFFDPVLYEKATRFIRFALNMNRTTSPFASVNLKSN